MKKQKNKRPAAAVLTTFEFTDATANAVFVAGSFNAWDSAVAPLRQTALGCWEVALPLSPGDHEYLFIVDGKWTPDPLARDFCPNPYEGVNAVVHV